MEVLDFGKKITETIRVKYNQYLSPILAFDDLLYLFGGLRAERLAEKLNTTTNIWEKLPDIPSKKEICYATLIGYKIIVFDAYSGSESFYMFDTKNSNGSNMT